MAMEEEVLDNTILLIDKWMKQEKVSHKERIKIQKKGQEKDQSHLSDNVHKKNAMSIERNADKPLSKMQKMTLAQGTPAAAIIGRQTM
jgi:hypothetical protein